MSSKGTNSGVCLSASVQGVEHRGGLKLGAVAVMQWLDTCFQLSVANMVALRGHRNNASASYAADPLQVSQM